MSTSSTSSSTSSAAAPAAAAGAKETKGSWTTSVTEKGEFKRKDSQFRSWIGGADGKHPAEAGRYHLYVCLACPWAHRTLIVRALKGLEDAISVTVVDWHLDGARGWSFTDAADRPGCTRDPLHNFDRLRQVYELAKPDYEGNVTVPVLFDKKLDTIVNNESSEIIVMLNSQFNAFSKTPEQRALNLHPDDLKTASDEVNEWIYPQINNGVYRTGFATSQAAYEEAFNTLFAGLDRLEGILKRSRYLVSNTTITLADVRLFTTLIRFDTVYHGHFKCNRRKVKEYDNIYRYMLELYQKPEIRATVDHTHIKHHYMGSHKNINPQGVISLGPPLEDLDLPHGRDTQFAVKSA